MALYGFDTIKLNEQWQASVGLRWDNYKISGKNIAPGRGAPAGSPHYDADREDNLFNYQLGLAYKPLPNGTIRSEEHTSELQSLMRISYAVFCLKKKTQ